MGADDYDLAATAVGVVEADAVLGPERVRQGDELLEPTRIYARDCLALVEELGVGSVHALAHITGGGLAGNTVRVVPAGLEAVLDRSTWALPPVVRLLEEHGVPRAESERAFNCGVGMIAAVAPAQADRAVELLTGR